ncbi:Glycosyl transferase, family 2 [Sphingobium herbicidovorans NBRC 16415]|uniref:Glycosyl transferase, family 2 n=1 Tax=Sphingobium herbicidovorans (strain ATCC 700291 / DSM 11019 / CCUG 56400 / KCTC 2939 / LMG 18315 / NBRC 16415 / MH) TaxID=1219045 RepID=A0A086PE64_SPHHM|nr:glycosyltransferase family 2 protein [Sphingobium herbicidovorans]KFG91682.1 Glycosyl transferase, family 2 [Sphingobium herbicidovorans NBRC 16415]
MTKLIIQIPCFNEAEDLPQTLAALPRQLPGIDTIEVLVIDDGSVDNTAQVASRCGVHHIVRHRTNRGLADAFRSGIDAALRAGADIIVNTDADGQYAGQDIENIVMPVLTGEADIVIGDRGVANNAHFGLIKRRLQQLGSAMVQRLSNTHINDAVSGFRAISREAAMRINITTEFSYTTDMLIQAGRKRLAIRSVPINTNATLRPSRLFKSIPRFILNTGVTMARAYTTYNPLRVFVGTGALIILIGMIPIVRFLFFYLSGDGQGHVQSLVLGGALLVLGALIAVMGILADLIAANRKLIEANLVHLRRIEDQLVLIQDAQPAEEQTPLTGRRIA